MNPPRTQYATSDAVHVAYRFVGDGPFDIVFSPGALSYVEPGWPVPS